MNAVKKTREKHKAAGMGFLQVLCINEDRQKIKDYVAQLNLKSEFKDGRKKRWLI